MKKIFNLILITILALCAVKVQAQTVSVDKIKSEISKQVVENYKKYTDAELSATVIALPFANMTLPEGKVSYSVSSSVDRFMARDLKKVNVSVNGNFVKTFNAPVDVKAYQNVLVAASFIQREQMLNSSSVLTKKMEVSNNLEYVLTPSMLDKEIVTKKTFREGEVIDKRFIKLKADVVRNCDVKAYYTSNNLMIEADATALSDGMLGDYISVVNKTNKKVFRGKIIDKDKVLIQI